LKNTVYVKNWAPGKLGISLAGQEAVASQPAVPLLNLSAMSGAKQPQPVANQPHFQPNKYHAMSA
ncbi:hypothetical protein, partial [Parvibium lacunae]